jgi:hypothetical protein
MKNGEVVVIARPKMVTRIRREIVKAGATATKPTGKPTGRGLTEAAAVLTASLVTTNSRPTRRGRIGSTR